MEEELFAASPSVFSTILNNPEVSSLLVMCAVTAFLYAALDRVTILRNHNASKLVMSLVFGAYTGVLVLNQHWMQLIAIGAGAVAAALTGIFVWNIGMQRGKTKQDQEERRN